MRKQVFRMTLALLGLFGLTGPALRADLKPHALFSEGMVLQRDMKCPVWGTGAPNDVAVVRFQGRDFKPQQMTGHKSGRWTVTLDDLKVGGPYEMTITGYADNGQKKLNTIQIKNVYVGEVWICSGQSNMEFSLNGAHNAREAIAHSKNPLIRLFTVPKRVAATPRHDLEGRWVECNPQTVGGFSAVAYFFGRDLQRGLKVPVGLIHTSWGGTVAEAWTSKKALAAVPSLKPMAETAAQVAENYEKTQDPYLDSLERYLKAARQLRAEHKDIPPPPQAPFLNNPNLPTVLYNGMIAPLVPYAVRGAIWYQGESNAGRAAQYRTLLPTMIANWRHDFHRPDLPFLIVQLAPFMAIAPQPQESAWAELREAQLLTSLNVPNVGLAVITDVGDERDIHPKKKEPVGARLALAARALAYQEKLVYSGPVHEGMKVEGDKAVLTFQHVGGGLKARGEKLTGFTIAGPDHRFFNAEATIKGDKVVVSSPQVTKPAAVRYGWANYPTGNLENKEGLPASPFRTDVPPLQKVGKVERK